MRARFRRPELRLELGSLGVVDPFALAVEADPDDHEAFCVIAPGEGGRRYPLELAGMNLVGAAQALLTLSMRWASRAPGSETPEDDLCAGEVRLRIRRREGRLLKALLKNHLGRLAEAPPWMEELLVALEEIDDFLRWEVDA